MNRHIFLAISLIVLAASACKKNKDETISCTDGKQNGTEYGVDCGGNCAPCVQNIPAYAILKINGDDATITQRSISAQNGYYLLHLINDSIQLELNIGPGTTGGAPISQIGSSFSYKNQSYPNLAHGSYIVSEVNTAEHYMNGNFNATFNYGSDSIRITSGQFYKVPYPN